MEAALFPSVPKKTAPDSASDDQKRDATPVVTVVERQGCARSRRVQGAEFLTLRSAKNKLLGLHPFA
jgi:hypothetical protein